MTDEALIEQVADPAAPALPPPAPPPPTEPAERAEPAAALAGGTERPADHIEIDRLAASLVPELITRLAVSGLGEIEIHQDDWKVRVRRPASARRSTEPGGARRAASHGGPSRPHPGHAGHGHAPAAVERPVDAASPGSASATGDGSSPLGGLEPVVVASPAVGVYRPGKQSAGARVRSGDRIGVVDMLGVPQDVIATVDGVLGESFVEPGEAVEYGQDLVRIEPAGVRG